MKIRSTEHFDMARKIVSNMTMESWRNIPHVCITHEVDMTSLLEALKKANNMRLHKISLNTVLMWICADSLKAAPKMNAHLHFNRYLVRGRLDIFDNIDISMASILPDGRMMTLNVRCVEQKTPAQLQGAIDELQKKAMNTHLNEALFSVSMADTLKGLRQGKVIQALCRVIGAKTGKHRVKTLRGKEKKKYYKKLESTRLGVEDLKQGTVTVSNLGAACRDWDGACTILEIIPPQVTAIGFGSLKMRPVADEDGTVRAAQTLPITIAFDHRAMDTADVAPFIKRFSHLCSSPRHIPDLGFNNM